MKAHVLLPSKENIHQVSRALLDDQVVGVPTETVYGLAGNAHSSQAVQKIFAAKERPTFDPLIVHIRPSHPKSYLNELESLRIVDPSSLSPVLREPLEKLMAAFWPGPLTLILPKHRDIPDLVTAGLSTVAVRMPRHPVMQALLEEVGVPLAAPSANRFAHISPTSAAAVVEELGERIPWILDGGPCEIGVESTILQVIGPNEVEVLRWGGVEPDALARLGMKVTFGQSEPVEATDNSKAKIAPGMLEKHYAPKKSFELLPFEPEKGDSKLRTLQGVAVILMSHTPRPNTHTFLNHLYEVHPRISVAIKTLSKDGDLGEIARHLFSTMREVDSDPAVEAIFCESCTSGNEAPKGLGHAIADRLRRAAFKAKV